MIEASTDAIHLTHHPGKLVLEVPVRSQFTKGPHKNDPMHGQEGVWYCLDGAPQNQARLEPFDKNGRRYLFELRPFLGVGTRPVTHQWLVRYWDRDPYQPSVSTRRIVLIEDELDVAAGWAPPRQLCEPCSHLVPHAHQCKHRVDRDGNGELLMVEWDGLRQAGHRRSDECPRNTRKPGKAVLWRYRDLCGLPLNYGYPEGGALRYF